MSRPRLLFISPRFLFPLDQGGRIRTANMLRHMKGGAFQITLASPAPVSWGRFRDEVAALCDCFLFWPESSPSLARKLRALPSRLPVTVAVEASPAGRALVASALAEAPDVVLVDFPHTAVLLPPLLDRPSIVFTHNVEAEIFDRHAERATGLKRLIWRDQARKMRRFEADTLRRFQTVVAVSERDAEALQQAYGLPHVEAIETGVDTDFYAYHPPRPAPTAGGTVAFTGSMDSRSNIEGVEFLMDEVWPLVVRHRPAAQAVIAGRNPPERLISAGKSRGYAWHFTGFVDDIRPHVAAAHAYAIPLRVGSGTRIKAFEAMAMGCPVVSTSLGVEGLDVQDGQHYLRADTAPLFAEAVLKILDDPALQSSLSVSARALVSSRFGWAQVTRRFEQICLNRLPAHASAAE